MAHVQWSWLLVVHQIDSNTVDGGNPANHQLRLVVYHTILHGFKNIQTVVVWDF